MKGYCSCELTRTNDHEPGGGEAVDVCGDDQGHGEADNHSSEDADGTVDHGGVEVLEGAGRCKGEVIG